MTVSYHNRQVQKSVFLKAGVTNEVAAEFVLGTARLETEPAGVSVESADGSYLGQTPLDVHDLPPQPAQFKLSKPGYEPVTVRADIVADQTTTCRTNLIDARYRPALQSARQYLAAANYENAAQAVGEALIAKPGDFDALALQTEANTHLSAERQRLAQLKRPRMVFDALCEKNQDAALFKEYEFKTSRSAQEVSSAIVKALQASPQAFDIENSWAAPSDMYETVAHQTFSLGILGGSERKCLLVVGQTKAGETQILFKVLEYQIKHIIQANMQFNVSDDKLLIPIHSSQMQMNDNLLARLRDGVQIVTEKVKQAIGQ